MKIELMCCTSVLLNEIKDKQFKKKNVAQTYALAIRSSDKTDWAKVNKAIIDRWSMSALHDIKQMAWKGKAFEADGGG